MTEELILVNEKDEQTGFMEKMETHRKGLLHRAFSVFIFNREGKMLLQQRSAHKYHSAALWTNACCSHPRQGETTLQAANRRLKEEMGMQAPLEKAFDFVYKASFENGLTEYEFDHVFVGITDNAVNADPEEVSDYCYKSLQEIQSALQSESDEYTAWFHIAFPMLQKWIADNNYLG
jgi:isopentenyl-diphosphate delta-isomerase